MKRIIIGLVILLILTGCAEGISKEIKSSIQGKPSIVGTWKSHSKNQKMILKDNQEMIIVDEDGATIKSGPIVDYRGINRNLRVYYTVDYSKDPIWFDSFFEADNPEEKNSILGIVNFIDDDTIELINNPNAEDRPDNRRENSNIVEVFTREK